MPVHIDIETFFFFNFIDRLLFLLPYLLTVALLKGPTVKPMLFVDVFFFFFFSFLILDVCMSQKYHVKAYFAIYKPNVYGGAFTFLPDQKQ